MMTARRTFWLVCLASLALCPRASRGAIAYVDAGTGAAGSTSGTAVQPATVNAGDLLLLRIVNKYPANGPSTPTGFTLLLQATGGGGSAGVDSGQVYMTVYYRIADGSEDGANIGITVTSGHCFHAAIARFSKAADKSWNLVAASGTDDTNGTGYSATATTDPGVTTGDLIASCTGLNGNRTISATDLAATGATFGTDTERSDTGTTTGDDAGNKMVTTPVSSGTASGNMTITHTISSAASGPTVFTRLREVSSSAAAFYYFHAGRLDPRLDRFCRLPDPACWSIAL